MDVDHSMLDRLVEFVVVSCAVTAISAFLTAFVGFLKGEFVSTRLYLFEMAVVFAIAACILQLGRRLLHHRRPSSR
jgi:hypothetical protein